MLGDNNKRLASPPPLFQKESNSVDVFDKKSKIKQNRFLKQERKVNDRVDK